MKPVILESPFAGEIEKNLVYARLCMHDCLVNYDEAPYASHLLYTQEHVLNDHNPEERERGIQAGFAWRDLAHKTVVYQDLGISRGMQYGINHAIEMDHKIEYRNLPVILQRKYENICRQIDLNEKVGEVNWMGQPRC